MKRRISIMENTFIMVKPDGVQRGLIGEVVKRFEEKGFTLVGGKLMNISTELAKEHYGEHKERPFFGELVDFITSGPVFAMVWQGENVISTARNMIGATNPVKQHLVQFVATLLSLLVKILFMVQILQKVQKEKLIYFSLLKKN